MAVSTAWECALRLAGKSPVLLVGTDGSMTSSADLTAAGGAWVAIGIMDDKDLHDEDIGVHSC